MCKISNRQVVQLKELCERITKGSTPTSYGFDYVSHGIRFIKAENIDEKGIAGSTTDYIEENTNTFLKRSILKADDLLFSIAGTIGRVGLVRNADLPANTNQALAIIRLLPGAISPRYLFYYLKSDATQRAVRKKTVGVGRANVSLANLGEVEVPVVPLDEQQHIVAEIEKQFSRLDEAVASLRRTKANLKRYKATVLKSAVEGKLTEDWRKEHPDVEPASKLLERILAERRVRWNGRGKYKEPEAADATELLAIPKGWTWARLEQLGMIFGGLTKNPKRGKLTKELPYLRVANVYANELRLEEIENIGVHDSELQKLLLQKGDLLVVEGNGSIDQIGRLAVWDGSIDPCVHQNHLIKVRLVIASMNKWILFWLLSPIGRHFIEKVSSSTSGLYTLSVNKVGDLPIIVPSVAEQEQIIAEVERRLSVIDELEASVEANLTRADRLRQSILNRAFTGLLR